MRLTLIGAAAALLVVAGIASATPGGGVLSAPVLARGLLDGELKIKIKKKEQTDVVVQQITIAPGGHTGWHSHPGTVVVVVKAGTLTYYPGDDATCTGIDYDAGEAFVDPGHGPRAHRTERRLDESGALRDLLRGSAWRRPWRAAHRRPSAR